MMGMSELSQNNSKRINTKSIYIRLLHNISYVGTRLNRSAQSDQRGYLLDQKGYC